MTQAQSKGGRVKFCNPDCRERGLLARRPARFVSKVDTSGGQNACHEWTGLRHTNGYGLLSIGTQKQRNLTLLAHRFAWELAHGSIPEGAHVLHRCDNPPCCNAAHLFLGNQQANNADRDSKDRVRHGERHRNAKLSESDVHRIRALYATGAIAHRKLARAFGVSHQTIAEVLNREIWKRT
jgi:hypothetical protein